MKKIIFDLKLRFCILKLVYFQLIRYTFGIEIGAKMCLQRGSNMKKCPKLVKEYSLKHKKSAIRVSVTTNFHPIRFLGLILQLYFVADSNLGPIFFLFGYVLANIQLFFQNELIISDKIKFLLCYLIIISRDIEFFHF